MTVPARLYYGTEAHAEQKQEMSRKSNSNVGAMDEFYRYVLEMETEPTMARQRIKISRMRIRR